MVTLQVAVVLWLQQPVADRCDLRLQSSVQYVAGHLGMLGGSLGNTVTTLVSWRL